MDSFVNVMFEFEFDKELSALLQTLKKPSLLNNFQ